MDGMEGKHRGLTHGADVTLCQADLSSSDALDLGSQELNAAFQGLADLVVVPGLAILDRRLIRNMC
jgi:hypothetical protein